MITQNGLKIWVKLQAEQTAANEVVVSVRPEKIQIGRSEPSEQINCYEGILKNIMYLGTHVHYVVQLLSGDSVTILQPNRSIQLPELEAPVQVYWSANDCVALSA